MLDLFVPTCRRDAEQLDVLLASLDTYLPREVVGSLTVAAIDPAHGDQWLHQIDTRKFRDRTRLATPADLGIASVGASDDGWRLQMAAKLLFARQAETDFYMVLDSKNVALRPISADDLLVGGRAAWVLEPMWSDKNAWWRGSAWALRHRTFERSPARLAISSATPVVFHAASVRGMVEELERRFHRPLDRVLTRRRRLSGRIAFPTEFSLYYVYLDREGTTDRHHFPSDGLHDLPSQIWQGIGVDELAVRLGRLRSSEPAGAFGGIQYAVWVALSEEIRSSLVCRARGMLDPAHHSPPGESAPRLVSGPDAPTFRPTSGRSDDQAPGAVL